jgi:hypothetical protein
LHVQGLSLDPEQVGAAQAKLRARGLSLRQEGNDRWLLQAEGGR